MERQITVEGIGRVSRKPDQIELKLEIAAKDMEYDATISKASEQLENLRSAVQKAGFEADALKTSYFNMDAKYEDIKDRYGDRRKTFIGYECRQKLKLVFELDMKVLARVISAISDSAAEPELSVNFTVKDAKEFSNRLLDCAAKNAKEKAQVLCKAIGAELGDLISIKCGWDERVFVSDTIYIRPVGEAYSCSDMVPEDVTADETVVCVWQIR